jgi:RNA-directed DNA polymerase
MVLKSLAANADQHYRPFQRSRGPGKAPRTIDNPDEQLKDVQRRVRARYLADQKLADSVRACVKGGSPLKNAKVHVNQENLSRVDVKNCYPSITNKMVFRVWVRLGFGPKPASLLTKLVTRNGHLPQGAPTSDMLANLVLQPIDVRAGEIASQLGLEQSRCMDDIALSGGRRTREAIGPIVKALQEQGLAVRHEKTGNAGATKAHQVTGLTVNGRQGPKVRNAKRREIRADVHKLILAHQRGEPTRKRILSVRGSLAYLRRTNTGLVLRLERQLDAAAVPFRVAKRRTAR